MTLSFSTPAITAAITALLLSGLIAVGSAPASANDTPEDVAIACEENSNSPEGVCECVGAQSAELTEDQRAFYVAAMNKNDAETTRLRGVIPPMELIDVATFMRVAPTDCLTKN